MTMHLQLCYVDVVGRNLGIVHLRGTHRDP